ncbi:MAG: branched-chain amino acid ABC transporter permease [Salinirussus sp.]
MVSADILASQFVIAVMFGLTYFVVALGLSLYFGILGVINFAHGEFYALGAYIALPVIAVTASIPVIGGFWSALIAVPLILGIAGVAIERPLRTVYDRDPLIVLLLTFGFAVVIREVIQLIWGTSPLSLSQPEILVGQVNISGVTVPIYWIFVLAITAILTAGVFFVFRRTRYGLYLRAASYDRELLSMFAIDKWRLYTVTFSVSVALAGLAGLLIAPIRGLNPFMGVEIIIIAFVVIIVGGLGSVTGTLIASFIMGFTRVYSSLLIPEFGDLPIFILLIIMLLLRPEGIMGESGRVH